MKLQYYFSVFCVACIGVSLSGVHAFEPVSIDEFFKQHPDERPVQPTISGIKSNNNHNNLNNTDKNSSNEIEIIDQDIPTTAKTYSQVDILLLDRILGRSQIVTFVVGETKALNNMFDVTISDCLERKTEFGYATQAVKMRVNGFADSKPSTQKTVLYDDIFYIQMPGFKGFEHSIYDIKPIKCTGKPTDISLEEPIIPKVIADTKIEPTTITDDMKNKEIKQENPKDIPVSIQPEPKAEPKAEPELESELEQETVSDVPPPQESTDTVNDVMGTVPQTAPNGQDSDNTIQDIIQNTDSQNPKQDTDSMPVPVPVPVPVPLSTE